jgi:hypothetical protein
VASSGAVKQPVEVDRGVAVYGAERRAVALREGRLRNGKENIIDKSHRH